MNKKDINVEIKNFIQVNPPNINIKNKPRAIASLVPTAKKSNIKD